MAYRIVGAGHRLRLYYKRAQAYLRLHGGLFRTIAYIFALPRAWRTANKLPVVKNRILFITFQNQYLCNPKYICAELLRRNSSAEIYWRVSNLSANLMEQFPPEVKLVDMHSLEYPAIVGTAHIIIDNGFGLARCTRYEKKPDQVYIQTLHGSLGIKRIDAERFSNRDRNRNAYRTGELTDMCLSNSSFETDVYRTSFWPDCRILETGHARNDILMSTDPVLKAEISDKVRRALGLSADVHIAMLAPTFSDESGENKSSLMKALDYDKLCECLALRFGGTWVILDRLHMRDNVKRNDKAHFSGPVCDGSDYPDIQELMVASDMGITDFSSWIFDYVLTRKPGIIFAPNLTAYEQEHGFYYPIETTPFPIAKSTEELCERILGFNEDEYSEKVEAFLADKGCVDDGKACARIADIVENILKGEAI